MKTKFQTLLLIVLSVTTFKSHAAVNDIFPADFVPLSPETTVATTYLFDKTSVGPYASGRKTADWKSEAQSAVFRLAKFKELNGVVVAGSFVAGYTQQYLSGDSIPNYINRSASGVRDLRFNGTAWLVNDPSKREFLAANATWMLPSGQYNKSDVQNIGENHHQLATTIAWLKGVGQHWNLELIGELAWHSDNRSFYPGDVKQERAMTHALTTYARYDWGRDVETYVGYEWNGGGKTTQDGISQNDPAKWDRAMIGLIYPLSPTSRFNLRLSRDLNVETGFAANKELALRWLFFY